MRTPEANDTLTPFDPLLMQHLTRGQLGYLPQAQFLTPVDYGVFRSLPTPDMRTTPAQTPSIWQDYLISRRGGPFGLPAYTFNTFNPAVNQEQYLAESVRRLHDQATAWGGAALGTGVQFAAGALAGGIPGLVLSGLLPDMATPYVDRIREQRQIQRMSMSKIVAGRDVDRATGLGFSGAASSSLDRFIRKSAADDILFKEGDYRKLLSLGMENGMFDYDSDVFQYKTTIKRLRKSLTNVMDVLGTTDFKELLSEFKRLQTLGANQTQFTGLLRKENMFAKMTGLRHSDMVETYGKQGAVIFSQAGLDAYQGSTQAMSNAAMVTLAQRQGLLSPTQIARYGGVSGLTQAITQEDANMQNKLQDVLVAYSMKDDMSGIDKARQAKLVEMTNNGTLDYARLFAEGGSRMAKDPFLFASKKKEAASEFVNNLGGADQMQNLSVLLAREFGKVLDKNASQQKQAMMGAMAMGMNPEIAALLSSKLGNKAFLEHQEREEARFRKQQREEYASQNTPVNKGLRAFRNWWNNLSDSTYGALARSHQRSTDIAAARAVGFGGYSSNAQGLGPGRSQEISKPAAYAEPYLAGGDPAKDGTLFEGRSSVFAGAHLKADPAWNSAVTPSNIEALTYGTRVGESAADAPLNFAERNKMGVFYGPVQMGKENFIEKFLPKLKKLPGGEEIAAQLQGDPNSEIVRKKYEQLAAKDSKAYDVMHKAYWQTIWEENWIAGKGTITGKLNESTLSAYNAKNKDSQLTKEDAKNLNKLLEIDSANAMLFTVGIQGPAHVDNVAIKALLDTQTGRIVDPSSLNPEELIDRLSKASIDHLKEIYRNKTITWNKEHPTEKPRPLDYWEPGLKREFTELKKHELNNLNKQRAASKKRAADAKARIPVDPAKTDFKMYNGMDLKSLFAKWDPMGGNIGDSYKEQEYSAARHIQFALGATLSDDAINAAYTDLGDKYGVNRAKFEKDLEEDSFLSALSKPHKFTDENALAVIKKMFLEGSNRDVYEKDRKKLNADAEEFLKNNKGFFYTTALKKRDSDFRKEAAHFSEKTLTAGSEKFHLNRDKEISKLEKRAKGSDGGAFFPVLVMKNNEDKDALLATMKSGPEMTRIMSLQMLIQKYRKAQEYQDTSGGRETRESIIRLAKKIDKNIDEKDIEALLRPDRFNKDISVKDIFGKDRMDYWRSKQGKEYTDAIDTISKKITLENAGKDSKFFENSNPKNIEENAEKYFKEYFEVSHNMPLTKMAMNLGFFKDNGYDISTADFFNEKGIKKLEKTANSGNTERHKQLKQLISAVQKEKSYENKVGALVHAASEFSEGDLSKDSRTGNESPVGVPNMAGNPKDVGRPQATSTSSGQGQLPLLDKSVANFGGAVNQFSAVTNDLKLWLGKKIAKDS